MFTRLLAAFILVPLIELMLLIQLANYTSLATTILLVIVTGVLGSWLARREGVMAWFRFQNRLPWHWLLRGGKAASGYLLERRHSYPTV